MDVNSEPEDEHVMSNTAAIDSIQRTHREALALAEQARNYIACRGPELRQVLPVDGQAVYAAESMRMSSRIIHVIAWTLAQKAVAAGEIGRDEACDPEWRLGGEAVCLGEPIGDLDLLPAPMQEMIEDSERLYRRVKRLDDMLGSEAETGTAAPAVHDIWQRIDRFRN